MPTFIIPVEGKKNRFVISQGRKVVEVEWDGEDNTASIVRVITEVDKDNPNNRFNDAKADPRGRLFAGEYLWISQAVLEFVFIRHIRVN